MSERERESRVNVEFSLELKVNTNLLVISANNVRNLNRRDYLIPYIE